MERTLWFCCSAALFSSPHLFKAVRQQSGAINLNRSALPVLLWLDVMISGCHSAHWYVSLCDPSASLFCHEQAGVYRGHAGGILPRSSHSALPPAILWNHHSSSPSLSSHCDIWVSLTFWEGGLQNICVRMFVKKVFLAPFFFFFLEMLIKAPNLVQKKDSPVLCANNEVTLPSENKLLMILFHCISKPSFLIHVPIISDTG